MKLDRLLLFDYCSSMVKSLKRSLIGLLSLWLAVVLTGSSALAASGDSPRLNSFSHKLPHGAAEALAQGIASGGDKDAMAAGAIGAVVGEIAAESTNSEDRAVNHRVGQIAARAVARLFGKDPNIAGAAAANAIQNNYLSGAEIRAYLKELDGCGDNKGCQQDKQAKYERISSANSAAMRRCGTNQNCLQGHLEKIRSANNMFDPARGRARGFTKLSAFDRQASQKLRTLQEQDGSIAEALNFYKGVHNVSEHLRENARKERLNRPREGPGAYSAPLPEKAEPSTYEQLAGACKLDPQNCYGTVKSRVTQDLAMAALSVAPLPGAALAGQAVRHGGKILGKTAGNVLNKITKNSKNTPNANPARIGGTNIRHVDPADANKGPSQPPYNPNHPIKDFSADGKTQYVRVYTEGKTLPNRSWMMDPKDIKGLTPKQIQNKFDLPELPTHVVDIKPPKGTTIRTGTVNSGNFGGQGGGTQFQLRDKIPEGNFTNPRPLGQ